MRLSTARRKDPMHLYFRFFLKNIIIYIAIREVISLMENRLYFNIFYVIKIFKFYNFKKFVSLAGAAIF